jgi:hypothetical protein
MDARERLRPLEPSNLRKSTSPKRHATRHSCRATSCLMANPPWTAAHMYKSARYCDTSPQRKQAPCLRRGLSYRRFATPCPLSWRARGPITVPRVRAADCGRQFDYGKSVSSGLPQEIGCGESSRWSECVRHEIGLSMCLAKVATHWSRPLPPGRYRG